ncbi:MAG: nucleotidyltransferase domain-containing protein [Pseudanabaenaceae cyanobacterium bins.39]|nr:nucleotidyltransferase domain-containing protein [Pseudanabaenaceae cyanobacterium bins.39]
MNLKLKPILQSLKQELKQLYGDRLVNLTLFGSQSRGDHEPDSDIDVLVVLRSQNVSTAESPINVGEEIKRTGKIVADLSLNHDVVITCLFMDELQYQTRNNALLRNIRKDGVLI